MYTIRYNNELIHDPTTDDLILLNPRCKLETNTVGEASFDILPNHPYYGRLNSMKTLFEIRQKNFILFRGRMVEQTVGLYNTMSVELEGVLGMTNGSYLPPFRFPEDFTLDSSNVVQQFLNWIITKHNEQVEDWQRLKVGVVTVTDPNNYIVRSSSEYMSVWNCLEDKLFNSALGGKLCIRYEADGNYVDYLSDYDTLNAQEIILGENLMDIVKESSAIESYSAVLPLGATVDNKRLTIETLPDGNLSNDFIKKGAYIYSQDAVNEYGWICCPIDMTTFDDVTTQSVLQQRGVDALVGAVKALSTVTLTALDLHFTDEQVSSFRIYRKVRVSSPAHGIDNELFDLNVLDINLQSPQDTQITIGATKKTLGSVMDSKFGNNIDKKLGEVADIVAGVQGALVDMEQVKDDVEQVKSEVLNVSTTIETTAERVVIGALADYVKVTEYNEYKETLKSDFQIQGEAITAQVSKVNETISEVNGEMTTKFNEISRYIKMTADKALILGSGDNIITLELDPVSGIVFKKNGVQFGYWDGTNFYTGNIIINVNEKAQFGDFAFLPRTDRSLMFLKVAGSATTIEQDEVFIPTPETEAPVAPLTWTVTGTVAGGTYGFTEQVFEGQTYWTSNNNGVDNSYALAQINFVATQETTIQFYCINYAETNYDFGIVYALDLTSTPIGHGDPTSESYGYIWCGKGNSSTNVVNFPITIPVGNHHIYVKYRKDSSQSNNYDCFRFRIEV